MVMENVCVLFLLITLLSLEYYCYPLLLGENTFAFEWPSSQPIQVCYPALSTDSFDTPFPNLG